MKKVMLFLLLIGLASANYLYGQVNPAVQLANHIADKMRDSLGLTTPDRNQIFAANMYLHNQKMIARQQTTNPDSLRMKLQFLEHKRDSIYQNILPPDKYQLYLPKKGVLVSTN